MRFLLVLILLASPAWAQRSYTTPYQTPYLQWCPGGSCIGNLSLGRFDLVLADDIYETVRTSDAAAYDLSLFAGSAWPRATVNTGGANLLLDAGDGRRLVTVTNVAISEGDTVTLTINGTAVVRTAKNPGPAGANEFLCITSTTVCATNLAAAFVGVSGVTATSNAAVAYFEPTAGSTYSLAAPAIADGAADGTFGTATSGADGQVLLGNDGTQSLPALAFALDPDTGIFRNAANVMRFITSGATKLSIESQVEFFANADLNSFRLYGLGGLDIAAADLAVGSCTVTDFKVDTGGVTIELCACRVANQWTCWSATTTNGPVD